MKICFVAPRYHTNQHFWVKTLQTSGHQVDFLVRVRMPAAEEYEQLTPTVVEHTKHGVPNYTWLRHHLRTTTPDVVIVRDASSLLALYTFFACKRLGIKAILYSQHILEDKPRIHVRTLQTIGLVPNKRITPIRKDNTHTRHQHAYYVPLITDYTYDITTRTYDHIPLRLLFVGKFGLPRKNHLLMLQALKQALNDDCQLSLTIVGYSSQQEPDWHEVQKYIKENNLAHVVTIKTNVSFKEMPTLYQAHDVFVLPSANEPFSISPLEAMSFALPPIITDQNGAQHCLTHGHDGLILPTGDLTALTNALRKLATDRTKLETLSNNALTTITTEHTPARFITLFKEAVSV